MGTRYIDEQSVTEAAEAEWRRDPELRREFNGNMDAYLAFKKADARGQVGIIGGRTQKVKIPGGL